MIRVGGWVAIFEGPTVDVSCVGAWWGESSHCGGRKGELPSNDSRGDARDLVAAHRGGREGESGNEKGEAGRVGSREAMELVVGAHCNDGPEQVPSSPKLLRVVGMGDEPTPSNSWGW